MKLELDKLYRAFFLELNIDSETGEFNDKNLQLKFASYPYIGNQYHSTTKKILFVGLDIGKDETPGYIQTFDERRENIAKESNFNPHIAGTYTTALNILKTEFVIKWEN